MTNLARKYSRQRIDKEWILPDSNVTEKVSCTVGHEKVKKSYTQVQFTLKDVVELANKYFGNFPMCVEGYGRNEGKRIKVYLAPPDIDTLNRHFGFSDLESWEIKSHYIYLWYDNGERRLGLSYSVDLNKVKQFNEDLEKLVKKWKASDGLIRNKAV